ARGAVRLSGAGQGAAGACGSRGGKVAVLQVAVKERGELGLRQRADAVRLRLPVAVEDHGRDAPDAVFGGGGRVGVDVELRDLELALVLARDVVEHRREHLAWAAPFGPEIDEHRL